MNLGLDGRVAVVTAASRGLGRATADALAAEGARLVVVARDRDALEAFAAPLGERCHVVAGDLTDPAVPASAIDAALSAFGRLDVVVVNTGGPPAKSPLELSDDDFGAAFETAFYPAVRLIRAAALPLCERGWGRIVIVSSTSIKAPKPHLALSAAARSALWAWAKSAAPQLFARGVTLNVVCPGPHATARAVELGVSRERPIGSPTDFGRIVTTLCGDAAAFITGSSLVLDGGELAAL